MNNNIFKHIFSKNGIFWLAYYFVNATPLKQWLSDRVFLSLQYRCLVGKKLNLNNPQTYNEKLQWLKIHDHNPRYPIMVDKYDAKQYVESIIGSQYIIPTLGVWSSTEEIDWSLLPNRFVLKCTHDSGGIVVCKDKEFFDKKRAIEILNKSLQTNFYYRTREWPYKNLTPRIIAEQYMEDASGELTDYKFFCFDGEPKAVFIASDRLDPTTETKFDFFDMNFNHLPFTGGHPNSDKKITKPTCFEEMKEIAHRLSEGIPHLRVDLYEINGNVFFGELTFYHWGGMAPFNPEIWGRIFGDWLNLPNSI